ncbi:MAG: DNA polymerase III subunit psi [Cytophagaceae bacterium]|nr:DNA polymerase III subunit psi [Cytophagaceae bacterium]
MNEPLSREALQQLFAGEMLFAVPEPILVVQPALPVVAEPELPQSVESIAVAQPVETPPVAEPVATLGATPVPVSTVAFKHQVLILTDRPSPADLELLANILKAVNLRLDEVEVLDLQKLRGQDFKPLLESQSAHQLITFGVGLKKLNLDIVLVPYQLKTVEGVQFLYADPLPNLHTDKVRKKALWISLQTLFGLG